MAYEQPYTKRPVAETGHISGDYPSVVARRGAQHTLSPNGKLIGRPPGSMSRHKNEARSFCRDILNSQEYKDSVLRRAHAGTLPPAVEVMLWHYAYGKPMQHVQVTTAANTDLSELSTEELAERAAFISQTLKDTADAKAAAAMLDRQIEEDNRRRFEESPVPNATPQ